MEHYAINDVLNSGINRINNDIMRSDPLRI